MLDMPFDKRLALVRALLTVGILVLSCFSLWRGFHEHLAWDALVRQNWMSIFMIVILSPGRWTFLWLLSLMPVVIWADIHDKTLTLATLRQLPFLDWEVLAMCLFLLATAVIGIGRKARAKPSDAGLPS